MVGIGLLGTVLTHIGLMGIISSIIGELCDPVVGIIGGMYAAVYTSIEIVASVTDIATICLNAFTEFVIGIIPFI